MPNNKILVINYSFAYLDTIQDNDTHMLKEIFLFR